MADITLKNVVKKFGSDVTAVDDLSLHIEEGELLVLLGPSGCGKTTTLRMIAGLETQTSGDIYIGEQQVNGMRAGERDIAFVFQFYALYPHLNVHDNISFPLRAQNLPQEEVDRRVHDVAQRLQIDHILNKRPGPLPGGEQQRVALGRAMVRQPQVFLMDEPLTNLDASLRNDMRAELKHLQQELGTTMVYVTHDQVEAMSLSHRIAVLNLGILQQVDTPLNIYRHPSTLFVATFIGSPPMNILPCRVDGAVLHDESGEFNYTLPDDLHSAVAETTDVYFGIRSEDISLVMDDESPADLQGEILIREPMGDETIYRVQIGPHQLSVKAPPKVVLAPNTPVRLRVNPARIHLFDQESEQSLIQQETMTHV